MKKYCTKIADYFNNRPNQIKKASGPYIVTKNNHKLIDFTSGWNVANLGWNNSEITKAVIKQARKNIYIPLWMIDNIQNQYAESLIKEFPRELNLVLRATGGTEANEMALKISRAITGRKIILGCYDAYHGQSMGTLSIGYRKSLVKKIGPLVGNFKHIEFPDMFNTKKNPTKLLKDFENQLERKLSNRDVAAFVTEAGIITGWGNTAIAPTNYLSIARKLTKKYGTLLILDEVGTGFSRLGKLFGMELENIVPDIVTLAKAITNGAVPMGTTIVKKSLIQNINKTMQESIIGSTFGWTPMACAAALTTLKIHKRKSMWNKAQKDGEYILSVLKKELKLIPNIKAIRGIGMEIGIKFEPDKALKKNEINTVNKIANSAYNQGLLVFSNLIDNILIMPPLTIRRNVLNKGLNILISVIQSISKKHK